MLHVLVKAGCVSLATSCCECVGMWVGRWVKSAYLWLDVGHGYDTPPLKQTLHWGACIFVCLYLCVCVCVCV